MKTIEQLEYGCQGFISLYEDIIGKQDTSEDTREMLINYYEEWYEQIKEMIEE